MANKKLIYVIVVLVLVIVAGGIYILSSGNKATAPAQAPEAAAVQPTQGQALLSEQPNMAKYNEYLSDIYLGKMAIGKKIGTDGFPTKTSVFTAGTDLFCTMLELKKTIVSGHVATAVYDTVAKQDNQPKTVFPMELKAGGSGGCSSLTQLPGKYEYKFYIDDVLAAVLPFEVR